MSPPDRLHMLLAFAAKVRSGVLGRGRQVQASTVTSAVCHVGQTFELAGHRDPWLAQDSPNLHLALTRLYAAYCQSDPLPSSQIALPVSLFHDMQHEGASSVPRLQAIVDS